MKKYLLFIIGLVCISIGMRAQASLSLSDGCYIQTSADGKTGNVHVLHEGCFSSIKSQYQNNGFSAIETFVFDNACVVSEADLKTVMCDWGNAKYFDFFDITNNGTMTTANIDAILTNVVNTMITVGWQRAGIILPFNSSLGTSAMAQKAYLWGEELPIFTDYVAYYRESADMHNLVMYVYDYNYHLGNGNVQSQAHFNALVNQFSTHNEINNAVTCLVSTNSDYQFDFKVLPANSKLYVEITLDDMVFDTPSNANIYVESKEPGVFADHIATAGTDNTPTELLRITGPVSADDIAAVSDFLPYDPTSNAYHGPRVLDLKGAQTPTAADVAAIENDEIEFILLPPGMNKEEVNTANNTTNMPELGAVISISADNKNLVAYLNRAGTLAEVRMLYSGGSTHTKWFDNGTSVQITAPSVIGLESVTLSGKLNGSDISANVTGQPYVIKVDGHLYEGGEQTENIGISALNAEQTTITSLDLSDAVFDRIDDMSISGAGLTYLTNVQLPTSSAMTYIPRYCLYNIQTLPELMIPSNYTVIKAHAFDLCTSLTHIYTNMTGNDGYDDVDNVYLNADAVDGGPNTYTIASTVTKIETGAFTTGAHPIMDVYVLARTTPLCERDAFQAGMYYGWGGLRGNFPYCREKYFNGDEAFTVLHFPNGISDTEKAKYTDLDRYNYYAKVDANRNNGYSQPDQTGALDGDGNPIVWPLFSETRRAYNQGISGYVWYDWTPVRDIDEHNWFEGQAKADAFGSNTILGLSGSEPDVSALSSEISVVADATGDTFDDYIGWHQFVLCNAGYFYDPVPVDDDTEYEMYDKWYSFCIPYDITVEEAVELMGDPRNNTLPDVRTLMNVYRFPSQNKIYLNISKDLGGDITFDESGKWASGGTDVYIDEEFQGQYGHSESVSGLYTKDGKKILIKGGYPYLVKPWFPVGMTAPKNLGVYILSKKQFPQASVGHTETICAGTAAAMEDRAPFIHHTVQALNGDKKDDNAMNYGGKYDGTDNTKYFYTFVGHYTTQPLPKYCYYLSGGQFRRYVNFTETTLANWKWNPYVTIIGVTATTDAQITSNINDINYIATGDKGYSYSDNYRIDLSSADDDRETTNAKYYFIFDDGMEDNLTGDDNETTAIELADGMVNAPVNNGKVYNMNGQFIGNSVNSLNKGLYIVNGKKFVVK